MWSRRYIPANSAAGQSIKEIAALLMLAEKMGTTDHDHDACVQAILPLLSLPQSARQIVEVNIAEGMFKLTEKVAVVDHAGELRQSR